MSWRRLCGHGAIGGAIASGVVVAVVVSAAAQGQMFTTSTGAQVDLPRIPDLDCSRMTEVLADIDQTGYRTGLTYDPRDKVLFEYEDELAHEMRDCENHDSQNFRQGFGAFDRNSD